MTRRTFRAFLFDMDGVLYRGDRPLPGARDLLADLDRRGIPYAMVTNNTTRTPRQYVRHLAAMGIRAHARRIVTAAEAAAAYLRKTLPPGSRVLVIGEPAFRRTIARAGFVPAWDQVAAVVVGLDRRLTYRKLAAAVQALVAGAAFVAANPDPLLPMPDRVIPGSGAIVAALQYASGRRAVVVGKPRPLLLREAAARIGARPHEAAMVGDQLSTDMAAGRAAGLFAILVQSGVAGVRPALRRGPRPDLTVRDLRELRRWLAGRLGPRPGRRGASRASRSRSGA
ncbi:MAG: HAD-IIA family hydrolase [Armatimonadota bacterium]|nr:HAD-IIA family hydrolase [Armatimonadota bacterium]